MLRSRAWFLALVLFLAGARQGCGQDSLAVLFIGNSHTYVNDLPAMVAALAESGGHPMIVDRSAPGGFTLMQHRSYAPTLAKLAQRPWDVVVLQEQSQIPMIPWCRDNLMFPAAMGLDSLIRAGGARTLLYMTWGWARENEIQCYMDSCSIYYRDYFHMQDSVTVAYESLGERLDCAVAPVGEVWRGTVLADPFAPLWAGDDYHPALEGSYLGACTFYQRLFDESPVGLSYTAGLDSSRASWLQEQAAVELPVKAPTAPQHPSLLRHWPNPFNGACVVDMTLPNAGHAQLRVLDVRGALVEEVDLGQHAAGPLRHALQLEDAPSGLYLLELRLDGRGLERQRMLLLR